MNDTQCIINEDHTELTNCKYEMLMAEVTIPFCLFNISCALFYLVITKIVTS